MNGEKKKKSISLSGTRQVQDVSTRCYVFEAWNCYLKRMLCTSKQP